MSPRRWPTCIPRRACCMRTSSQPTCALRCPAPPRPALPRPALPCPVLPCPALPRLGPSAVGWRPGSCQAARWRAGASCRPARPPCPHGPAPNPPGPLRLAAPSPTHHQQVLLSTDWRGHLSDMGVAVGLGPLSARTAVGGSALYAGACSEERAGRAAGLAGRCQHRQVTGNRIHGLLRQSCRAARRHPHRRSPPPPAPRMQPRSSCWASAARWLPICTAWGCC